MKSDLAASAVFGFRGAAPERLSAGMLSHCGRPNRTSAEIASGWFCATSWESIDPRDQPIKAGFSFIGIGVQPPTPSLGSMIGEARNYMLTDSWLMTIPGVTIALLVIGMNLLGDGLRDIFDPRLKDE